MYITSIFYLFEKCTKNLEISLLVSLLLFVDDSLLISQEKSYKNSLAILTYSYSIIFCLFTVFGLVLEYKKSEVFHFSRTRNNTNPSLDLTSIGGPILKPKETWRYLEFYFNKKLIFQYYVQYYANKVLFTVKALNILGNSSRGLLPIQK